MGKISREVAYKGSRGSQLGLNLAPSEAQAAIPSRLETSTCSAEWLPRAMCVPGGGRPRLEGRKQKNRPRMDRSLLNRETEGVGRREQVPQSPRPDKTDHGQLRIICLGVDGGENTVESSRLVAVKPKSAHRYLGDLIKMQILIWWLWGCGPGPGARESALLTRSQVTRRLLVWGPQGCSWAQGTLGAPPSCGWAPHRPVIPQTGPDSSCNHVDA